AIGLTIASQPARAWSFDVHRWVTDRAIQLLPAEIRPFFEKHRAFVVEHSIDPDLWRNAGFLEEPPRHFLDLDGYGPYPFSDLPRDYDAAVKKYGKEMVERNGLLPWRTAEIYDKLARAFRQYGDGTAPFAGEDIKFFSAVIAHYTGDAHVPFHAALNYDGQLTNQHGIHARFEGELMRRYQDRVTVVPKPAVPVRQPRDFIFETLLSGFPLTDAILAVDRKAVVGREEYDDAYFDQLFAGSKDILERRLGEAASGIAGMIAGAWETAGKPPVPLEQPRVNRKIRSR
ncbi:MAG: hypothetical protein ACRD1S_14000, partial [Vicinamibacterales bacterium]